MRTKKGEPTPAIINFKKGVRGIIFNRRFKTKKIIY